MSFKQGLGYQITTNIYLEHILISKVMSYILNNLLAYGGFIMNFQ